MCVAGQQHLVSEGAAPPSVQGGGPDGGERVLHCEQGQVHAEGKSRIQNLWGLQGTKISNPRTDVSVLSSGWNGVVGLNVGWNGVVGMV